MQHYALFRLHKWICLGVVIPYPTRCCNGFYSKVGGIKIAAFVGDISCPLVNLNGAKVGIISGTAKCFAGFFLKNPLAGFPPTGKRWIFRLRDSRQHENVVFVARGLPGGRKHRVCSLRASRQQKNWRFVARGAPAELKQTRASLRGSAYQ